MIKYIAIAYTISTVNMANNMANDEYCETKDLQSPYVEKIDESTDRNPTYTPIGTCNIAIRNIIDTKEALLECVKLRQNWRKL